LDAPDGAPDRVSGAKRRRRRLIACKEERQSQGPEQACQRVRSGLTLLVTSDEGKNLLHLMMFRFENSGQLRFLGL
jgi:hypothetical protein